MGAGHVLRQRWGPVTRGQGRGRHLLFWLSPPSLPFLLESTSGFGSGAADTVRFQGGCGAQAWPTRARETLLGADFSPEVVEGIDGVTVTVPSQGESCVTLGPGAGGWRESVLKRQVSVSLRLSSRQ